MTSRCQIATLWRGCIPTQNASRVGWGGAWVYLSICINNPIILTKKLHQKSASKSWPNSSFEDLTKIQLQNFRSNFSLRILTKIQLQNLDRNLASKSWSKFSFKISVSKLTQIYFKILTKHQIQYRDQISGLKSLPNLSFRISTKLLSTLSSATTSAKLTTLRSFELASSKASFTSAKSTKREALKNLPNK